MLKKNISLGKEAAEFIAIQAVRYMAQNPEAFGSFLVYAGVGPADLKASIQSPEFLAGVLDYLMTDEPLLLDFAKTMDLRPQDIVKARLLFPGAEGELVCS